MALSIDECRFRRSGCPALLFLICSSLLVGQTNVVTYHNDNSRTGLNARETILTPANVNSASFGKLFVLLTDGKVDAQPLYVSGVTIAGVKHNVLYVATEHGSLYAFDAMAGTLLWHVSLLKPGETTSDARGCGQVVPEIGITATPVIDTTALPNPILYAVAMSKDTSGVYHQRLHAVDITNGAEQLGGPVAIQATFPGTGDFSSSGTVTFDPKQYKERAGLLLLNGVVYTAWSSHCDIRPYTAWVIGYNARTLARTSVLNLTPNGSEGSVWASGAASTADTSGNIYFLMANGTFDTTLSNGFPQKGDYGNAFVKLSTANSSLHVADYFAMFNAVSENNADQDLGSGGALLLPDLVDSSGHTRHLAVGAGKDQNIYLVDRDNMGKFNASKNSIYQELSLALGGQEFGMPAYFNGKIYYGAASASIKAFQFTNALLSASPVAQTSMVYPYPGATPSISANGPSNAILWAAENNSPAVLHAYNASNLSFLYNSNQAPNGRDQLGVGNKFITPTIANGRVYVGTTTGVGVFGLLTQKAPIVFETESLPATTSGPQNQILTWVGFTDGVGTLFVATTIGDYVTYTANVPAAGVYDVKVAVKKYHVRGQWQLSLNGTHVGSSVDEYDPNEVWAEFDLGTTTIGAAGPIGFKFTIVGKNSLSSGYKVAFDYIKLTPQ